MSDKEIVEVAKEQKHSDNDIHTLSTGVRVRVKGVSASLIAEVQSCIKYNDPPVVEKDGRTYENPDDPKYKRHLAEVDERRGMAATDAFVLFGVELVDGLPDDEKWVKLLKIQGIEVDDDPDVREFQYKKYIAVGAKDLETLGTLSISPKESRSARRRSA